VGIPPPSVSERSPVGKFSWCLSKMMLPVMTSSLDPRCHLRPLATATLLVLWATNLAAAEFGSHGARPSISLEPLNRVQVGGEEERPSEADHSPWDGEFDVVATDAAEARLLADAADGRLDEVSFLDAVLIANGIRARSLSDELRQRFQGYVERLRSELAEIREPRQRCEAIHQWLHRHVLIGRYQADCTQISRALRHGDYNCVSATLLFQLLCQACEVPTVAVATPTHVYARLVLGPARMDVQTTCPDWFRMSSDQRRRFPQTSERFAVSPERAGGNRSSWGKGDIREISDIQLLAKVYYNRGVRHLDARRFGAAEHEFRTSLLLDAEDRSAQENLLATLNNWALQLAEQEDYAEAAAVLNRGFSECPDYAPFQANDLHIHQKWALLLCRRAHYGEALQILEAGQQRRPEVPLYRDGPHAVRRLWMKELVERRDYAGAWRIALGRGRDGAGPFPGRSDLESLVDLARQLAASGRRVDALRLLDEGLRLQSESSLLKRTRLELNAGPF
jgi:tetratricopeptide (TPR) repeat protein